MMKFLPRLYRIFACGIGIIAITLPIDGDAAVTNAASPTPITIPDVHNAFRVTDKIFSGSQPESDAAFAALAQRGVKTIISVDGSQPDVGTARKHGLRYIHLPYGYDGIPTNRVIELVKAATGAGPFFVHCHHGKHRGPAAVAIMCLATSGWTTNQAEAWLREAGTSTDYPGLYRAARDFTAPPTEDVAAVKDLPESARTSTLVEAMVAIDAHFDHLKQSQQAGWGPPAGHADISPAHEATLLWEQLREIARLSETGGQTEDYRGMLTQAEQLARSLRAALPPATTNRTADEIFRQLGANCAACHKSYRNQ